MTLHCSISFKQGFETAIKTKLLLLFKFVVVELVALQEEEEVGEWARGINE